MLACSFTWDVAWVTHSQGVEDTEEKASSHGSHSTAVLDKAPVRMLPDRDNTENINTPGPYMCFFKFDHLDYQHDLNLFRGVGSTWISGTPTT